MQTFEKNRIIECRIENYSHTGSGVAHVQGHVLFVPTTIAGELCRVRIVKIGKDVSFGRLLETLEPSPERVLPACTNFPACGGCKLMHMSYDEELAMKRRKVDDALARIGGLDLHVEGICSADETLGYRNKSIFAVGRQDGQTVTGLFQERSHRIIPTDGCLIQTGFANRAATALREWMDTYDVSHYDEATQQGCVRRLFCRFLQGTGQGQVAVVTHSCKLPYENKLVSILRTACPECVSIVHNINESPHNTVFGGTFRMIWGTDAIADKLCGLTFKLAPRAFYQVNSSQAARLYETVLQYADPGPADTVCDLFCGVGTITLLLARQALRAIGVEEVSEAIDCARENASANGIGNVDFVCADAQHALSGILANNEDGETPNSLLSLHPDIIVVDPPRKGLSPSLIRSIAAAEPKRVVYVSCDPATLARDLKAFATLGYNAQRAHAFDMFPRTHHVETVALIFKDRLS